MKVSVVVPIYKVERYLDECLKSIVKQTFSDFEVICVDDASPDHSMEIVRSYQEHYGNIHLITNEQNMGLSASRNRALEVAKGKYILFVDSDDYIHKDTLATLYERMERDKLDIVYFNKKYFYDADCTSEREKRHNKRFGENEVLTGREMFTRFHLADSFKSMNAYTQFFRRDFLLLNDLRFYEGIVHEDYLFYFLCAMKAKRVGNYDKSFYYYRKRDDSITGKLYPLRKQSIYITLSEIIKYWKENEFTDAENRAIERFSTVVLRNCENYKLNCNSRDELIFSDDADKFLYKYLMNTGYVFIRDQEWEKLRKGGRIWIYGAGKVAHELVGILEKKGISIEGVLVTKTEPGHHRFYGWDICGVDDVDIKVTDTVIIAAAGYYKKEMLKKAKEAGFQNIICASKSFDKYALKDRNYAK